MTAQQSYRVPGNVHWRRFDSDVVLLDLNRGEYLSLNDVGAEAFERLAAGRSMDEIVEALLGTYDVERVRLEGDLMHLVDQLIARGLLIPTTTG